MISNRSRAARLDKPAKAAAQAALKYRPCLVCKTTFPSQWAGERICARCKTTTGWRSGALRTFPTGHRF